MLKIYSNPVYKNYQIDLRYRKVAELMVEYQILRSDIYHITIFEENTMSNMMKVFAMSAITATIALTGCSAKRTGTSEVVVAPMGVGTGSGYYNGGALVTNSSTVVTAANGNPKAVYFGFDSSEIDAQGQAVLSQHAALLKSHSDARVQISGHTDERGSREYNMALGERRAKAAQSYLSSQGVDASRTEAVSFGEDQPAAAGHDEASWALNRRAELSY